MRYRTQHAFPINKFFVWKQYIRLNLLSHPLTPTEIFGRKCLKSVLQESHECLASVLQVSCKCLASVLPVSCKCLASVLQLSCNCLASVFQVSCKGLESVLQVSYKCLADDCYGKVSYFLATLSPWSGSTSWPTVL